MHGLSLLQGRRRMRISRGVVLIGGRMGETRKIAAVLAADVVGYSRLAVGIE
jgi:class 3 adenylate cyclase